MILFRLILLAVIAYLIYRVYHIVVTPRAGSDSRAQPGIEPMVQCAHCALHIPRKTAVAEDQRWYCCEEHRQQHRPTSSED